MSNRVRRSASLRQTESLACVAALGRELLLRHVLGSTLVGPEHELAMAYRANGQVKNAVALLEQVVKIREQSLTEDHLFIHDFTDCYRDLIRVDSLSDDR